LPVKRIVGGLDLAANVLLSFGKPVSIPWRKYRAATSAVTKTEKRYSFGES
jgi:hypothetical protein